jgi:hypothetical protein
VINNAETIAALKKFLDICISPSSFGCGVSRDVSIDAGPENGKFKVPMFSIENMEYLFFESLEEWNAIFTQLCAEAQRCSAML